jgi:hypothetical protein
LPINDDGIVVSYRGDRPQPSNLPNNPHIPFMATWQQKREPPKTKDELRAMLRQAVENTQPEKKPKASKDKA